MHAHWGKNHLSLLLVSTLIQHEQKSCLQPQLKTWNRKFHCSDSVKTFYEVSWKRTQAHANDLHMVLEVAQAPIKLKSAIRGCCLRLRILRLGWQWKVCWYEPNHMGAKWKLWASALFGVEWVNKLITNAQFCAAWAKDLGMKTLLTTEWVKGQRDRMAERFWVAVLVVSRFLSLMFKATDTSCKGVDLNGNTPNHFQHYASLFFSLMFIAID